MRLEVSKRTDLALQALAYLETVGDVNGRDLATGIATTPAYLPQLLKPLTQRDWIRGTSGPGGGYHLSVDLAEISVLDVIEAMEGDTEEDRCVLRGAPCPAPEPCALHDSWLRARGALLTELGSTSVATTLQPAPTKGE